MMSKSDKEFEQQVDAIGIPMPASYRVVAKTFWNKAIAYQKEQSVNPAMLSLDQVCCVLNAAKHLGMHDWENVNNPRYPGIYSMNADGTLPRYFTALPLSSAQIIAAYLQARLNAEQQAAFNAQIAQRLAASQKEL